MISLMAGMLLHRTTAEKQTNGETLGGNSPSESIEYDRDRSIPAPGTVPSRTLSGSLISRAGRRGLEAWQHEDSCDPQPS